MNRQAMHSHDRLALAIVCAIAAALFFPVLANPGAPLAVDQPAWTSIAHLLRTEVIPDQGWFVGAFLPSFNAGQVVGSSYSLNLMILWLLNLVFPPEIASKVPCLLTAMVLAAGIFLVARREAGRFASGFAAVLSVVACGELILQGMWYDVMSVGMAFILWRIFQPGTDDWSGRRWLVATLLFGATIYMHPIGTIAATVIWAATLLHMLLRDRSALNVRSLILVAAIFPCALMLAAPQVAGLLGNTRGGESSIPWISWESGLSRLFLIGDHSLVKGRASIAMIAVLLLGVAVHAKGLRALHRDFLLAAAGLVTTCVFIMVQIPLVALVDCCRVPFLGSLAIYATRFSYLWGPLVILLFCALLGRSFSGLPLASARLGKFMATYVTPGFAAIAFVLTLYLAAGVLRSPYQLTMGTVRERTELLESWSWLRSHTTRPDARTCLEHSYQSYTVSGDGFWEGVSFNSTHVFELAELYVPGMQRIGGSIYSSRFNSYYYLEEPGSFLGVNVSSDKDSLDRVSERLRKLRCGFALAHSDPVRSLLSRVPSLKLAFQSGGISIFRNELPENDAVHLEKIASHRYRFEYDGGPVEQVVLPLSYSVQWIATLSGKPLTVDEDEGLLRIHFPAAAQAGEVQLRHGSSQRRRTALLVLLAGLALSLATAVFCFRSGGRSS